MLEWELMHLFFPSVMVTIIMTSLEQTYVRRYQNFKISISIPIFSGINATVLKNWWTTFNIISKSKLEICNWWIDPLNIFFLFSVNGINVLNRWISKLHETDRQLVLWGKNIHNLLKHPSSLSISNDWKAIRYQNYWYENHRNHCNKRYSPDT